MPCFCEPILTDGIAWTAARRPTASFTPLCAVSLAGTTGACYVKLHRIVYTMPGGMRPFFRGDALRVTDKHSRRVVGGQAQPHGWTQAQIETERRVGDREKVKITLPSPEHLKRIMRDAPSLEDGYGFLEVFDFFNATYRK